MESIEKRVAELIDKIEELDDDKFEMLLQGIEMIEKYIQEEDES